MGKAFAVTKEQIAVGGMCDAAGGAQVAEVYQIPTKPHLVRFGNSLTEVKGGRNMEANDAHRIVAKVSLGKKSMLFRLGRDPKEHAGAVDELSIMLKREKSSEGGRVRVTSFPMKICRCIAVAALEELTLDSCKTCHDAGLVRDHALKVEGRQPMKVCPTCMGRLRRQYNDDERVMSLARAWIGVFPEQTLDDPGAITVVASSLRKHHRLDELLNAVGHAKGILLDAERVAVEEIARMYERNV